MGDPRKQRGGVVHTYRKYEPQRFPMPDAEAPVMVSPAFEHMLTFGSLRHVTETIGGESRDQVAVNAIMGHVDPSMAAHYRERISDERLRAVTDAIHGWLFTK